MDIVGVIEEIPLAELRAHPENATIFGDPEEDESFSSLKQSIRDNGQWEPIIAKADGTVLSGHSRLRVLKALKRPTALVRRVLVDSYREELEILIRSNTDRRQMSPRQIAFAFKRLKETAKEDGGSKQPMGRPKKGAESSTHSKTRDAAAETLGVSRNEATALETVFTTEGVPEAVKQAVDSGKVAPTTAAKAVVAEKKRQGGEIKEPGPLTAWAGDKVEKKAPSPMTDVSAHEQRVDGEARRLRAAMATLFEAYKTVDGVLSQMPLKRVLGFQDHNEYLGLIRDIAIRTWREVESVNGDTTKTTQLALVKG